MKRCEYCLVEIPRPRCVTDAAWAARRYCTKAHSRLGRYHGARMTCGHCERPYQALDGHGCFCTPVCAEAYAERERAEAVRLMAAWTPRTLAAA